MTAEQPQPDARARARRAHPASSVSGGGAALLQTEGLSKTYTRRRVVDGVSIHVHEGEIVGLLGPNGAGKTTSFRMVVGMVPPDQGQVRFAGKDITRMPMYRRARRGLGYLSQEPSVFRRMSVLDNVIAVLEARRVPRKERLERAPVARTPRRR